MVGVVVSRVTFCYRLPLFSASAVKFSCFFACVGCKFVWCSLDSFRFLFRRCPPLSASFVGILVVGIIWTYSSEVDGLAEPTLKRALGFSPLALALDLARLVRCLCYSLAKFTK